jgi:hypothetical protein
VEVGVKRRLALLASALLLGVFFIILYSFPTDDATDFTSCLNLSGQVMESSPHQCVHNGQTFVEHMPGEEPLTTSGNLPVNSFEDCRKYNIPITRDYPGRCSYNGKIFTQEVK